MTDDEADIAAVRYLEQQGNHNSRALLLAIGESTHKDAEGWAAFHKKSAGFKNLPRDLYKMRFQPEARIGAGVLLKLTEKGERVYKMVQSRIGKKR